MGAVGREVTDYRQAKGGGSNRPLHGDAGQENRPLKWHHGDRLLIQDTLCA